MGGFFLQLKQRKSIKMGFELFCNKTASLQCNVSSIVLYYYKAKININKHQTSFC